MNTSSRLLPLRLARLEAVPYDPGIAAEGASARAPHRWSRDLPERTSCVYCQDLSLIPCETRLPEQFAHARLPCSPVPRRTDYLRIYYITVYETFRLYLQKRNLLLTCKVSSTQQKLRRQYHLSYDQTQYVVKEVRRTLAIKHPKMRKRVVARLSREEETRLITHKAGAGA